MNVLKKFTGFLIAVVMAVTAIGFSSFVTSADSADIVINEVCLGNKGENGNLTDVKAVYEKKGATVTELCDWIELYNPTDSAVDISDYQRSIWIPQTKLKLLTVLPLFRLRVILFCIVIRN